MFDTVTITGSDWQYKEYVAASELVETEDFSVSYYILEQGGLNVLAEKCRATAGDLPQAPGKALSAAIYAYGATTQRAAVLGIPYTKTVTATEFSDISEMLDALDAEDGSVVVLLCDFDKAALKENYPGTIRWSGDCGGNSGFAALKDAYPEASFYCIEDLLYEPNSSFLWAKQGRFAKMVSRESLARYTYSPVTYAYTASDLYGMSLPRLISRAGKALDKADCGVVMNYLGSELYGDYSGADGATRSAYLRAIEAMLEEKGSGNAVEGGNEYAIGQADFNYNIPVNSSAYAMQTQSVPFLQMVYHGNVLLVSTALNLTENPQKELLSCIASGTVPCFAVTAMENENLRRSEYKDLFGTCFAAQEETITELLDRTKDYYQTIYDQHIIDYECVNGVSVTTFEDGVRVIVNFNRRAAEYEGRQIAAMDFEIIQ